MPVEFTPSADRHGIAHEDAIHAILNADGTETVRDRTGRGRATRVYVGRPHPQAERRIEVIAWSERPDRIVIFHVMEVTDLYRHLIRED